MGLSLVMEKRVTKTVRPVDQLAAGKVFFADLGLDVQHFASVWHIFKVGQLMVTDLNRISGLHGLSISDFHLLSALMMSKPEPMRATDIAYALNVSNAALSVRVKKLDRLGLLTCSVAPNDRRTKLLHLTESGIEKVWNIGRSLEDGGRFVHHYRQLPEADREALDRIMGTLHMLFDRDFQPVPRNIG